MPGRPAYKGKKPSYFEEREKIAAGAATALSRYQQTCTACGNMSNLTVINASGYCEICEEKFKTYGKTDVVKKEYQEDDNFGSF